MFIHKEPTKSPYDLLQTTNPAKSRAQNGNGIVFHPKWHGEKKKTTKNSVVHNISSLYYAFKNVFPCDFV